MRGDPLSCRRASVFHAPVFTTLGQNLEIQTTAIGHFVVLVFWLCGLDLSGVELHFGGTFLIEVKMPPMASGFQRTTSDDSGGKNRCNH